MSHWHYLWFSACPQCLYYSQSGTNISHQPLPSRDHCILSHPPISVQHIEDKHIEDSDTKVAEEIIDVGIEEFPVVQQNAFTKSNSAEKVRKKNSDSKVIKIKSKSSSSEKSTVKPPRKEKGEVQKKSVTEPKAKMSPIKVPKERKKSTSSKKEAKLQRTICLHGWRLHGPMENKKVYSYVSQKKVLKVHMIHITGSAFNQPCVFTQEYYRVIDLKSVKYIYIWFIYKINIELISRSNDHLLKGSHVLDLQYSIDLSSIFQINIYLKNWQLISSPLWKW